MKWVFKKVFIIMPQLAWARPFSGNQNHCSNSLKCLKLIDKLANLVYFSRTSDVFLRCVNFSYKLIYNKSKLIHVLWSYCWAKIRSMEYFPAFLLHVFKRTNRHWHLQMATGRGGCLIVRSAASKPIGHRFSSCNLKRTWSL